MYILQREVMMSILESLIMSRMDRNSEWLGREVMYPNRNVEVLRLSPSGTTVEREVFPDGTKGNVRICTNETQNLSGSYVCGTRYILKNGKLMLESGEYDSSPQRAPLFRRVLLVRKLLLNFPDVYDE